MSETFIYIIIFAALIFFMHRGHGSMGGCGGHSHHAHGDKDHQHKDKENKQIDSGYVHHH